MGSEAKHTPGPFTVGMTHHEHEGKTWLTFSDQADIIHPNGLTSLACVDVAEEEGEANARLFAAAPDMLEALELVRQFGGKGETDDGMSVSFFVENAITKATGRC